MIGILLAAGSGAGTTVSITIALSKRGSEHMEAWLFIGSHEWYSYFGSRIGGCHSRVSHSRGASLALDDWIPRLGSYLFE